MDINFEYYKVFYYVAKFGAISKAAEKLCVSQPAISQLIKKLEEQLGTNVFYRGREGITLTEEGKKLYTWIENSVMTLENVNKQFGKYATLEEGTIRIRTGNTVAKEVLYRPLAKFMKKYPNIKFEITNGSNKESMKWLSQGELDIVLMNLPIENIWTNVEIIEGSEKEFIFVMSKKFRMKYNVEINEFNDLKKYKLLLPRKIAPARKILESIYEEAKDIEGENQISSEDIKVELAKNDCGIAFIEKFLIEEELETGKLIEIKLPKKIVAKTGIATMDKSNISFATKKLVEMILE